MDDQERQEISVFGEFVSACSLGIKASSIEKRDPPEPDILCSADENVRLAFELIELVDRDAVAKLISDQLELMDCLRDVRKSLPKQTEEAWANAWVEVKIRPNLSLRKRKELAQDAVGELLAGDPQFEGKFALRHHGTEVAQLNVKRRDGLAGPHFHVPAGGAYDPVPVDAIERKFGKVYKAAAPIHLLAYFDTQYAPPEERLAELVEFIKANISHSPFERAWIFSRHDKRILYPDS